MQKKLRDLKLNHRLCLLSFIFIGVFSVASLTSLRTAHAVCVPACPGTCTTMVTECSNGCSCFSEEGAGDNEDTHTDRITDHYDDTLVQRLWLDRIRENLRAATAQLGAVAFHQVKAVGTFFDAKHQLETQRLFQTLAARAHKDYHPSEGLCEIGTSVRSLAASNRNADLTTGVISNRAIDRQSLSKETISKEGQDSDDLSRLKQFIDFYCDPTDHAGNLNYLCLNGGGNANTFNRDINYTETVGRHLTIDADFLIAANSDTERDLFALSNYLYAHNVMPTVGASLLVTNNVPNENASTVYLDARALTAKRSVAVNSFAAIAGLKSKGEIGSQPFIYSIIREMGDAPMTALEIEKYIGDRPSYHAQMEVLTKKLRQNPLYYTELYDKPANVLRKDVTTQAIELMQKRDIFRSLLRSEAILSVMLETALMEEQDTVDNEIKKLKDEGIARAF